VNKRWNLADIITQVTKVACVTVPQHAPANNEWIAGKKGWLSRKYMLSSREIELILWWLSKLLDLMDTDMPYPDELVTVRLNLAYAEQLLYSRLARTDRSRTNIEHFNQNKVHDYKSMKDLLGECWLSWLKNS